MSGRALRAGAVNKRDQNTESWSSHTRSRSSILPGRPSNLCPTLPLLWSQDCRIRLPEKQGCPAACPDMCPAAPLRLQMKALRPTVWANSRVMLPRYIRPRRLPGTQQPGGSVREMPRYTLIPKTGTHFIFGNLCPSISQEVTKHLVGVGGLS